MKLYDVRIHIKKQNKLRLIGDICVVLFLIAILGCIVYERNIANPFHVRNVTDSSQPDKAYKDGLDYVHVNQAELEFTGYYKEDKKGNIIYNCYATRIGNRKYFVFVPVSRSGENPEEPAVKLTKYTFTARLHKDGKLIKMVAEDNNMTVTDWSERGEFSSIVLDEANLQRTKWYFIWAIIALIILICIIYGLISFYNLKSIYNRSEIVYLKRYGEIDALFDQINDEVEHNIEFDSIHLKITKSYILCFYSGKIFIDRRDAISKVQIASKIKKVYGIVNLGYERFLQFVREDQVVFELPIENMVEEEEIIKLLNNEFN